MLNLTLRRFRTATKNFFPPSRPITISIFIFALAAVSCNKRIPDSQLCTCDVDSHGNVISIKGAQTFNGLAVCGVFNLPVDPTQGSSTTIIAELGFKVSGLYEYAELLANPANRVFFLVPDAEASTEDLKYFISASVNDLKGRPLVMIKDNKWFVYLENVGKYNYDANGLEVYDKAGHISLSLNFIVAGGYNDLVVQGVIPDTDSTLEYYTYTENHYVDFKYRTPAEYQFFQYIYTTTPIQPIFRYTGPGWQHARLSGTTTIPPGEF